MTVSSGSGLHPQAAAYLQQLAAAGLPPTSTLSPQEARANARRRRALQTLAPDPVAHVENRQVPVQDGEIGVRIYHPLGAAEGLKPLLVYFHGGGFVQGDLDSVDAMCRVLANGAGAVVVSVDYRLAPEFPFPTAVEDAYAATRWAAEHAAELGADASRLAVAGDSAGGNLATVMCLLARERGGPAIRFQSLHYPITDLSSESASYESLSDGYGLSREDMRWFGRHYLPNTADRQHPYVSPLRAESLSGLPPALVITAELDPLRDEAEAYAERLRAAGVPVTLRRYPGMIHGFLNMLANLDDARAGLNEVAATLRQELAVQR